MPTDPTTAEKAERLGLTKCVTPDCPCGGLYWLDSDGIGHTDGEVDALFRKTFPMPTAAPDYRAALEALVDALTIYREWHPPHGPDDGQDDALYFALTHARKVLHG